MFYGISAALRDGVSGSVLHISTGASDEDLENNYIHLCSAIKRICAENGYEFCALEVKKKCD